MVTRTLRGSLRVSLTISYVQLYVVGGLFDALPTYAEPIHAIL